MLEMVAYNLRRQGFTAIEASDGPAGLAAIRTGDIDVLVLDLMLPGLDGMQIAKEVRRSDPGMPILMLTARDEEQTKLAGFEAGIDDFLTKPFSMEELVARVKALRRRNSPQADADEIVIGDMRLNGRDLRCWIKGTEISLRPKEFALLETLASKPGRLFTRVDLAERVWGYSHLGDTRTIDTHVKNVRKKLEAISAFTYIETVRGAGYRWRVQPR